MRSLVALALAAAALAAPAAASADIKPGVGMSSVRLGMTEAAVRAVLGPPSRVVSGRNEFGPFRELRYRGSVTFTLQGLRSVTAITTEGVGDRTAAGVGVGSTEARVRATVRGVRCSTIEGFRSCTVGRTTPGGRVTDFFIRNGRVLRVVVGLVID